MLYKIIKKGNYKMTIEKRHKMTKGVRSFFKHVIFGARSNAMSCKMSTIWIAISIKETQANGNNLGEAHKTTMKRTLQVIIPPYWNYYFSYLLPPQLLFSCLPFLLSIFISFFWLTISLPRPSSQILWRNF